MPPPGESKFLSAKGLTLYFQRYTRIYITPFTFSILSLCAFFIFYSVSSLWTLRRARVRVRVMCARKP